MPIDLKPRSTVAIIDNEGNATVTSYDNETDDYRQIVIAGSFEIKHQSGGFHAVEDVTILKGD